jgi:hypothetical protein
VQVQGDFAWLDLGPVGNPCSFRLNRSSSLLLDLSSGQRVSETIFSCPLPLPLPLPLSVSCPFLMAPICRGRVPLENGEHSRSLTCFCVLAFVRTYRFLRSLTSMSLTKPSSCSRRTSSLPTTPGRSDAAIFAAMAAACVAAAEISSSVLVASEEEEGSPHRDLRSGSMVRGRLGGWDERRNGMRVGKGRVGIRGDEVTGVCGKHRRANPDCFVVSRAYPASRAGRGGCLGMHHHHQFLT